MNLKTFSLITHIGPAAVAAVIAGLAFHWGGAIGLAAGVAAGAVAATVCGLLLASRVEQGIAGLKESVATRRWEAAPRCGIAEFDEVTAILSDYDRRVSASSVRAQEQIQDVQKLLGQLDRRSPHSLDWNGRRAGEREVSAGRRLRDMLTGLARATNEDLKRVLALSSEIEQNTKAMAAGASDQSDAVSKTTTYVEQMSSNIDLVTMNAEAANQAAVAVRDCSVDAQKIVKELISGMERIRRHVEAGWRKLRALGDRTQEIGSIVETIAGIAARTDMLALNASIESVRAGEHGRGFAVVADEVRKLAEQAAQATKEVAGLIETVQLETQESIGVMAQEHSQVEAEVGRVNSAGDALEKISHTSTDSANRVGEISRVTKQQLRFTQEVVLAMERISEVARGIRGRAEGVSWTTNTLSGLIGQLDTSLSPLRNCVGEFSERGRNDDRPDDDATAEDVLRDANELLEVAQTEGDDAEYHTDEWNSGARIR
jgi:methyl-accepting chemotaxis protein